MYCAFCGHNLTESTVYCTKCGKGKVKSDNNDEIKNPPSAPTTSSGRGSGSAGFASASGKRCLSFESFYAKKSNDRLSHFKIKKTSGKKRSDEPRDTFINVGIMKNDKGEAKPMRGKTLPLKVNKDIEYDEFLEAALVKRVAYDRSFDRTLSWLLVYPDGKLARTLPGCNEHFTLRKYKEDIGKPYSRLTFFLCSLLSTGEESDKIDLTCDDFFYDDYEPIPIDMLEEILPGEVLDEFSCSNIDGTSCTNVSSTNHSSLQAIESLTSTHSMSNVMQVVDNNGGISSPTVIDDASLRDVLKSKLQTILSVKASDRLKLVVRRRRIWSDTMEKLALFFCPNGSALPDEADVTFHPLKCSLDVKFIGEEGVDQGGLTRDFFSSVFEAGLTHVMQGNPEKEYFTLQHNCLALESKEYFFYGVLVGLALLHGCPGPRKWTPTLARYILKMDMEESSTDEVPDHEVRKKLCCLSKCESEEQLNELLLDFPERFDAGYAKGHVSLTEKHIFVTKIIRHFVISVCLEEIQQLVEGLNKVGVLSLLERFKDDAIKELIPSTDLLASAIMDFWCVEYSPEGSNKRVTEEDIVYNFSFFLDEVAQGKVNGIQVHDIESGQLVNSSISLHDVLQFLTGARYFCQSLSNASLEFDHEAANGRRVDVSTCSLTLKFPCNSRYTGSSKDFVKNFSEDIICSPGFGKA